MYSVTQRRDMNIVRRRIKCERQFTYGTPHWCKYPCPNLFLLLRMFGLP